MYSRTHVPPASCAGVSKSDLLIAELAAMESISWDVYSIARQVKVVF